MSWSILTLKFWIFKNQNCSVPHVVVCAALETGEDKTSWQTAWTRSIEYWQAIETQIKTKSDGQPSETIIWMIVPWRSPRILSLNVLLVGWKFWVLVGLQVQSNNNWQHLLAVFAWWYVKNTLLPNYFNQLFCFLVAIWVRIQSFLSLEKKEKKKLGLFTIRTVWSGVLHCCAVF